MGMNLISLKSPVSRCFGVLAWDSKRSRCLLLSSTSVLRRRGTGRAGRARAAVGRRTRGRGARHARERRVCRAAGRARPRSSLDYTRKSDVADQVGYWYCERLRDGWTRLYYSTDFQIPRWVRAPAPPSYRRRGSGTGFRAGPALREGHAPEARGEVERLLGRRREHAGDGAAKGRVAPVALLPRGVRVNEGGLLLDKGPPLVRRV